MDEIKQFSGRAILVYMIGWVVVGILGDVVWGATAGLIAVQTLRNNPLSMEMIRVFGIEKGLDAAHDSTEARSAIKALSTEGRRDLEEIGKVAFGKTNWFLVTLFVSAVAFGIVGFLGGFFARVWLLAGVVPILSLLTNNSVLRFPFARDLSLEQKAAVIVFSQFAVSWALAYCGARLGLKRHRRKVQKAGTS